MALDNKQCQEQQILPLGIILDVECSDLDNHGQGIAHWKTHVLIVPNLIPGEEAKVKTLYRKGSLIISEILFIKTRSSGRKKPICSVSTICGGCSLQHLEIKSQLDSKINNLKSCLKHIAKVDTPINKPIHISENQFGYRNRALIPIEIVKKTNLVMGFYRRNSHEVVPIRKCPVLDSRLNKYINSIQVDLQNHLLSDEKSRSQINSLRHLGIRVGVRTGEVLISLIGSKYNPSTFKTLSEHWLTAFEHVVGITFNIQPNLSNTIFGTKTILISGKPYIKENFCKLSLNLATTTFFQVNTPLAEEAVYKMIEWFESKSQSTRIVDAYCGVGTLSLPLAARGYKILGIEINVDSIKQAKNNSIINNIYTTNYISGDVDSLLANNLNRSDSLILDPPRKGLTNRTIQIILARLPRYIVYLSCNPATLARDLNKLSGKYPAYLIDEIYPIDFFPQTSHLETMVCLVRSNSLE